MGAGRVKKRIFSLVALLVLFVCAAVPAFAAPWGVPYYCSCYQQGAPGGEFVTLNSYVTNYCDSSSFKLTRMRSTSDYFANSFTVDTLAVLYPDSGICSMVSGAIYDLKIRLEIAIGGSGSPPDDLYSISSVQFSGGTSGFTIDAQPGVYGGKIQVISSYYNGIYTSIRIKCIQDFTYTGIFFRFPTYTYYWNIPNDASVTFSGFYRFDEVISEDDRLLTKGDQQEIIQGQTDQIISNENANYNDMQDQISGATNESQSGANDQVQQGVGQLDDFDSEIFQNVADYTSQLDFGLDDWGEAAAGITYIGSIFLMIWNNSPTQVIILSLMIGLCILLLGRGARVAGAVRRSHRDDDRGGG
uniref:Uncharacterized protein n=1 Tax=Dulem virus 73 TaxID=3145784 RepID=A0AAU8AV13_9VIRU